MKLMKKGKKFFSAIILLVLLAAVNGCTNSGTYDSNDDILPYEANYHQDTIEYGRFTDYSVIIGETTAFPLNGILSMPNNTAQPVPAAVIVHGSGGHDMDGNMFGNAPYRDMAEYLAANGVAVIRHDKRNFAHGAALVAEFGGDFTVWEESIEDALFAAALLRTDPRIDPNRIFLIGHSLGAMLAPRIQIAAQEREIEFAGLILMAGTPREFTVVALEQFDASLTAGRMMLETLEGEALAAGEAEIAAAQAQTDFLIEIADMIWETPAENLKEMFFMGGSFYYIHDLASPSFEEAVADVHVPMLVMQGGKDFQVLADVDFVMLQDILSGRTNVTFKLYEGLNHLFMPTTATNFLEHRNKMMQSPETVYTQVLRDVVVWIFAQ